MADIVSLVEKLIAKAEDPAASPQESETYLAKAQELVTRHAIDMGIIDAARVAAGQARSEKITHVRMCQERNTKLIKAKRQLVMWLADANNGHVLMARDRSYLEVHAHESDLAMIQALYSSIIVQMATAMSRAENAGEVVGGLQGWRVSYAHGYVRRVGLRMLQAKNTTAGTPGNALVLADRKDAVVKAYNAQFGEPTKGRKIPNSDRNHYGRAAGYRDGQNADLGGSNRMGTANRRELG